MPSTKDNGGLFLPDFCVCVYSIGERESATARAPRRQRRTYEFGTFDSLGRGGLGKLRESTRRLTTTRES